VAAVRVTGPWEPEVAHITTMSTAGRYVFDFAEGSMDQKDLLGASWKRCRTHYTANLMSVCPKHALGG
jgi:hypothetical protein